ncbi:MAG TPA: glycosyltransferase family A protein [Opitutaceae bacterium]|nr:glycosyltransferase family A protein [Opitutaceae bacterium]
MLATSAPAPRRHDSPPSLEVAIIICTRGRPLDLASTLASLADVQVPSSWTVDLLIVENGTDEGARKLAGDFRHSRITARHVFEPQPGKSNALNRALRETAAALLLFTDDDVRFPSDWIVRMCEPIVSGRADAVAGGVVLAPHLLRPWMTRTHRAWLASTADYLSAAEPSEMCGANMAVSRCVFDRVGGYDVELGPGVTNGGEETLFSWQIREAGFRLVGALDVPVVHHLRSDRLRYAHWTRTARLQGHTRAYLMHHWQHKEIGFPRLREYYLRTKLVLRRMVSRRRKPEDEGIAPWEMSYLQDIAQCSRFVVERRRARNYTPRGLRKLTSQPIVATV